MEKERKNKAQWIYQVSIYIAILCVIGVIGHFSCSWYQGLSKDRKREALWTDSCTDKDLKKISWRHQNLNRLLIAGDPDFSNLEPIEYLTKLNWLVIRDCPKLTSLKPLQNLTSLEELCLYSCPNLTDLEPLEKLTGLKYMELLNCPNISVEEVKNLQTKIPNCKIDYGRLITTSTDE